MDNKKINTKYKDRVFKVLFSDKENLLSLYNALNDTNLTDPDSISINTLEDAIYISTKNDLSFIIDDCLNAYEHQSTLNPNMPLRGLVYVAALLHKIVNERMLTSTLQMIPTPRFTVFYNGERNAPETEILKLSDAFIRKDIPGCLEFEVTMININAGKNKVLMEKCKALADYSKLIFKIREQQKAGHAFEEAVHEAVQWCIENDVLRKFLSSHKKEVVSMFLSEHSEDDIRRASSQLLSTKQKFLNIHAGRRLSYTVFE